MKWIVISARIILGLLYLMATAMFFLKLGGNQPLPEGDAGSFSMALVNTGTMTVIKILELIGAVMLLSGQYVRLATVILFPISINILLFHTLMAPVTPLALAVFVLNAFLLFNYKEDYKVILKRQ